MGRPLDANELEAQRQAALRSAAQMRRIILRHRITGLHDLIRAAKEANSPVDRVEHYRSILKKAERELAAAEKA